MVRGRIYSDIPHRRDVGHGGQYPARCPFAGRELEWVVGISVLLILDDFEVCHIDQAKLVQTRHNVSPNLQSIYDD